MKKYIDEMLHLTADIAEELLTLKDTGNDIDEALCNRINRLAHLASSNRAMNADESIDNRIEELTDKIIRDEAAELRNDATDGIGIENDEPLEAVEVTEADALIEAARKEAEESEAAQNAIECNDVESLAQAAEFEEEEDAGTPQIPEKSPNCTCADKCESTKQTAFSPEQIRNAFSINDIFLFQRTLFKGSSKRMTETFEAASQFKSIDELRNYLSECHQINLKSDEAIDFIGIVAQFIPG